MQRSRLSGLPLFGGVLTAALGMLVFVPARSVVAQRRPAQGTLEVRAVTGVCGTCAMPPGPPQPARHVALRVVRENRRRVRTQVSTGVTDGEGVARFALRPGRYCIEPDSPQGAPTSGGPTEGNVAACETVVAGRTADMLVDVRVCPQRHCTGMEP